MAAATSTTTDLDQKLIKKAMVLLHSSHPDSAAELRKMLDEAIKQRYGADKMISNTMLTPRILELEKNFPGRATTPVPEPEKSAEEESAADEVINLTNSPPVKTISDSPETTMVVDSDDEANVVGAGTTDGMSTITGVEDDGNLKDFGDLNCCVCAEMMFTATNRLIECSKCGALYHQECHKPPITDDEVAEQEHNWQCDACFNKPSTSKAAGIVVIPDEPISLIAKSKSSATSSRSSSSSNSSSPYYKQEGAVAATTAAAATPAAPATTTTTAISSTSSTTSKHHHKSSSSSSSKSHKEKEERSTKSTASEKSSSSTHTSRKSSHSSKSSSGKSSSKHHESSSSKRKSQK